ncbi:hypothetical protein DFAR_3690061 [Desulfarculales bacterium]
MCEAPPPLETPKRPPEEDECELPEDLTLLKKLNLKKLENEVRSVVLARDAQGPDRAKAKHRANTRVFMDPSGGLQLRLLNYLGIDSLAA